MEITWLPPSDLKPDPRNPNHHSKEQIQRLSELIKYQGWRWPIVVSKQDGMIKAGHGRLLAAKLLKLDEVPVCYQDFLTDDQAYAFLVSDNAISDWADLDLSAINMELPSLGPDFDIEFLGIKDFVIEPLDKFDEEKEDKKHKECPACHHKW